MLTERDHECGSRRPSPRCHDAGGKARVVSAEPTVPAGKQRTMSSISLTIDGANVPVVRRLLLKMKAGELSDLRRAQTQLSVYGDRRASMDGEPAAIAIRLEVLTDLLAQIDAQ